MTTGKDYGLPEEYADWVEKNHFTAHEFEPMVRIVTEKCTALYPDGSGNWTPLDVHTFIPPKPKPTLPEVGPGAVVRYRCKAGSIRRAIRGEYGGWRVFEKGAPVIYGTPVVDPKATDADLLSDVTDDGFTVELDGLE